jgi:hypothetical protein
MIMSGFVEQLRLAEKAAEDIYFAKLNRELIEALHQQRQAEKQRPCVSRSGAATGTDEDPCQSADVRGSARLSQT